MSDHQRQLVQWHHSRVAIARRSDGRSMSWVLSREPRGLVADDRRVLDSQLRVAVSRRSPDHAAVAARTFELRLFR